VVSGLGALIAWTLIVTETSRAIAQDDLFRGPFAWSDKRVRPGSASLWARVTVAVDALALLDEFWSDGLYVPRGSERGDRRHPYFFSAIAQLTFSSPSVATSRVGSWLVTSASRRQCAVFHVGDFRLGLQVVYQALVVLLAGLVLYASSMHVVRDSARSTSRDLPDEVPASWHAEVMAQTT